ncbi:MAG TPA: hypothetical protein VFU15_07025 [Bacteroidia bacterium]|nr:hypothetical protein [Bacteroidia bacterium]
MKRTLLLPVFLFAAALPAQVTLVQSQFPHAGDIFTLNMSDTTGVLPGNSGTNVTWNFTSLNASQGVTTDSFMTVGSSLYGANYPQANLALHETGPSVDYFVYYDVNSATADRVGNADSVNVITYTNPATQFYFPMSYGTTGSDTYYATYSDAASGSIVHVHGTTSCNADGTGTLQLPASTYTNVLRAHFTRYENDTVFTTTSGAYPYQISTDYYLWYITGQYYPLLSIQSTVINIGFSPSYRKYVGWRNSPLDVPATATTSTLFAAPNPASSTLQLAGPADGTLSFYAADGKLLMEKQVAKDEQLLVDVTGWEPGLVLVVFRNNEMTLRRSVMISR